MPSIKIIVDLEMHCVPLKNCQQLKHLSLHDLVATVCCLLIFFVYSKPEV
jgi:hypothetical protein